MMNRRRKALLAFWDAEMVPDSTPEPTAPVQLARLPAGWYVGSNAEAAIGYNWGDTVNTFQMSIDDENTNAFTLTGNTSATYNLYGANPGYGETGYKSAIQLTAGHVYLMTFRHSTGGAAAYGTQSSRIYLRAFKGESGGTESKTVSLITSFTTISAAKVFTAGPADAFCYMSIRPPYATPTFSEVTIIPELYDLTAWYGAGNEPTAEQFVAEWPDYIPA